MKVTYYKAEVTLVIRLSDKAITRGVSQDWHTHISYAADGTVVGTVILEAVKLDAWPLEVQHAAAAWCSARPGSAGGTPVVDSQWRKSSPEAALVFGMKGADRGKRQDLTPAPFRDLFNGSAASRAKKQPGGCFGVWGRGEREGARGKI